MSYKACDTGSSHAFESSILTRGPQKGGTMERVTLRIPEQQVKAVEALVEEGEFPNRSEAIRAAVRTMVTEKDGHEKLKENRRIARV